jgi:hypothetical protein
MLLAVARPVTHLELALCAGACAEPGWPPCCGGLVMMLNTRNTPPATSIQFFCSTPNIQLHWSAPEQLACLAMQKHTAVHLTRRCVHLSNVLYASAWPGPRIMSYMLLTCSHVFSFKGLPSLSTWALPLGCEVDSPSAGMASACKPAWYNGSSLSPFSAPVAFVNRLCKPGALLHVNDKP